MKSTLRAVLVLSAAGGAVLAPLACKQPPASCQIQGHYRLVMTPKSTPAGCTAAEAETMDFTVYSAVPDVTQYDFIYQPQDIQALLGGGQSDPSGKSPNGTGKLPADSTAGLCTTTALMPASQSFDALPTELEDGGVGPTLPATKVTYEWKKLEIISTARALGTLLRGELVKTVDACAITYDVTGITPVASCEVAQDCYPYTNPDGGRPTAKTGIPADVSLLPNGDLAMMCTGGGLDGDGAPTGVCDVDYSKRSFDEILKAVQ